MNFKLLDIAHKHTYRTAVRHMYAAPRPRRTNIRKRCLRLTSAAKHYQSGGNTQVDNTVLLSAVQVACVMIL